MLPDKDVKCHRTGFEKSCRECVVEHKCQAWVQVLGTNPQTGETLAKWACADAWGPMLQVETNRKLHEVGAAIESFRNESLAVTQRQYMEELSHEITKHLPAAPKALDHVKD